MEIMENFLSLLFYIRFNFSCYEQKELIKTKVFLFFLSALFMYHLSQFCQIQQTEHEK